MTFCIGFQNMKIKGKRVTSSDAPVICGAPHSSFFDVMTAFYCLELPSFVSRAENNEMFLISGTLTLIFQGHFLKNASFTKSFTGVLRCRM
jgi:hypothetical protein